jgi:hypothetical protein
MFPTPASTDWSSSRFLIATLRPRVAANSAAPSISSASAPSRASRGCSAPSASQNTLPNLRVSRRYTSGPPSSNSKHKCVCGSGRKAGCRSGASAVRAENRRGLVAPAANSCPVMPRCSTSRAPSSSTTIRYFPSRSIRFAVRPASARRSRAGGVTKK